MLSIISSPWAGSAASALLGEWQLLRAALGTKRALTEVYGKELDHWSNID